MKKKEIVPVSDKERYEMYERNRRLKMGLEYRKPWYKDKNEEDKQLRSPEIA